MFGADPLANNFERPGYSTPEQSLPQQQTTCKNNKDVHKPAKLWRILRRWVRSMVRPLTSVVHFLPVRCSDESLQTALLRINRMLRIGYRVQVLSTLPLERIHKSPALDCGQMQLIRSEHLTPVQLDISANQIRFEVFFEITPQPGEHGPQSKTPILIGNVWQVSLGADIAQQNVNLHNERA